MEDFNRVVNDLHKLILNEEYELIEENSEKEHVYWIIEDQKFNQFRVDILQDTGIVKAIVEPNNSELINKFKYYFANLRKLSPYSNDYIGVDESGKGDYFGPLVVAGFISNKEIDQEMILLGVKDSKLLKDKQLLKLSTHISKLYSDRIAITIIEPELYSELVQLR